MTYPVSVLVPTAITTAMLTSSSIAEPAATETAWVSAGTYVVGDLRIRSTTHKVYKCAQGHTGRTALPEVDSAYWLEVYATQQWAMFDSYATTQSSIATTLTTVLKPGFFNAVALINVDAYTCTVTYKETSGGATVETRTIDLQEYPLDWYDYAFGQITAKSKLVLENFLPYPDPELTVTLTGATVKCGMLAFGDYRNLLDGADFGGTQYGATAEPQTFSYIKTDEYGNTVIKQRGSASDMRVSVVIPTSNADLALATMQSVLDVPAVWVASTASGYSGLTVFGLASGSLSHDSYNINKFSITVKGLM